MHARAHIHTRTHTQGRDYAANAIRRPIQSLFWEIQRRKPAGGTGICRRCPPPASAVSSSSSILSSSSSSSNFSFNPNTIALVSGNARSHAPTDSCTSRACRRTRTRALECAQVSEMPGSWSDSSWSESSWVARWRHMASPRERMRFRRAKRDICQEIPSATCQPVHRAYIHRERETERDMERDTDTQTHIHTHST